MENSNTAQWLTGQPEKKGFYLVKIQAFDIPYEIDEVVDYFDGTYWGYAQFVVEYLNEKVSVPFSELPQQRFFMQGISWVEQIKLCKFGQYGMGIDENGTVAKVIDPAEEVLPIKL